MTSADSMLTEMGLGGRSTRTPGRRVLALAGSALVIGMALLSGCSASTITREPKLTPPSATVAPYDQSRGEVLFAVVPVRNETGVSQIDPLAFSDKLVAALEEVKGIRCVPINRTLETMRTLKITQVSTPAQARQVAQAMGVDGLVLGSLTAWEPYDPVIGITLALHARQGSLTRGAAQADPGLDPRQLSRMPVETAGPSGSNFAGDAPTNLFSDNLDGKDHRVLEAVKAYARGRIDPTAAMGWERYVKSMDLYQQFAAHHAVERLMESEKVRLGVTTPGTDGGTDGRSGGSSGSSSGGVSGRVSKTDNRPGG